MPPSVAAIMTPARRRPPRPAPKPGERRPVLMSIQPHWSRLVQSAAKPVELRRQRSGCEPGTPLVIYTSQPVKRVEAVATVKAVHAADPLELWETVGEASRVPHDDFIAYLGDLHVGYAIELCGLRPVEPFALARRGPQSWRYLFADEPEGRLVLSRCGLL